MTAHRDPAHSFQDMILALHDFWSAQGCLILQPYDMQMGAGTFHTATTLRALGPEPWSAAFVQPCRRPTDGRYGENPNRLQHYYQYQVILKPSPSNIQDLYLESLRVIGRGSAGVRLFNVADQEHVVSAVRLAEDGEDEAEAASEAAAPPETEEG